MGIRKPLSPSELEQCIKEVEPLKVIFDAFRDHVIITDVNVVILYANDAVTHQSWLIN